MQCVLMQEAGCADGSLSATMLGAVQCVFTSRPCIACTGGERYEHNGRCAHAQGDARICIPLCMRIACTGGKREMHLDRNMDHEHICACYTWTAFATCSDISANLFSSLKMQTQTHWQPAELVFGLADSASQVSCQHHGCASPYRATCTKIRQLASGHV